MLYCVMVYKQDNSFRHEFATKLWFTAYRIAHLGEEMYSIEQETAKHYPQLFLPCFKNPNSFVPKCNLAFSLVVQYALAI